MSYNLYNAKTKTLTKVAGNPDQNQTALNTIAIEQLKETVKTLGGSVTLQKVTELPTTDIKTNVIYLKTTATEGKYDQYIYDAANKTWVSLGTTEVDLDAYLKIENIVIAFSEETSDEKVASEKLVKDTLDTKADLELVSGFTNLESNADLNTLINYGTYRTTTKRINSFINIPVKIAGMLEVRLTGSVIYQTYKTIEDTVYIRSSEDAGVSWSSWVKNSNAPSQHYCTQEEYDAMEAAGTLEPDDDYNIYEE